MNENKQRIELNFFFIIAINIWVKKKNQANVSKYFFQAKQKRERERKENN
jgi:hypothetical protein